MRVLLPMVALAAAMLVAVIGSFYAAFRQVDSLALERQAQTIRNAILQHGHGLERELRPEAVWADAYTNTTIAPDTAWMEQYYGAYLTSLLGYHGVYVLAGNDRVLYADVGGRSNDPAAFESSRAAIADMLKAIRLPALMLPSTVSQSMVALGDGQRVEQRSMSDVRRINGVPSNVVIETIVPDGVMREASVDPATASLLVAVFNLDAAQMRSFANTFEFDDLGWVSAPARFDTAMTDRRGQTAIRASDGSVVGVVGWIPDLAGGQVLKRMTGGFVAAVLLLTALAVYAFASVRAEARRILASEQREAARARTDFLTGLPNRLALSEALASLLEATQRSGRPVGFVFMDLDGFKHINDSLGHSIGDAALAAMGRRLGQCSGGGFVARSGGDEFALLLDADSVEEIDERVRRLSATLNTPLQLADGPNVLVGCSIGYCIAPRDGIAEAELFRRADLALSRAKGEGRGHPQAFDAAIEAAVRRRHVLEGALRRAIAANAIDVAFQPLMDRQGQAVLGVEALARWTDRDLGPILPAEFIPIAEETGLIVPLGEQVMRKAMVDARPWSGVTVSVNVSAQQIQRTDMVATIERLLRECDFPASRLEIELTESILVADEIRADEQMKGMQNLGIKVALDDFGTGYASLLYLRQFGFDKLKIDRNFVKDVDTSIESKAMVISITSMSRALGLDVTAEGVENAAQLEFLKVAGCDRLQGYYFSRPVAAADLTALLKRLPVAA